MPENDKPSYRRRKYFVKRAFQLRYTVTILIWILLAAVISYGTFYYQFMILMKRLPISSEYVQFMKQAMHATFFARLAVLFLLGIFAGILISHKIAGPLYRMERDLKEIVGGGNLKWSLTLRKGDELQELAGSLNTMMAGLKNIVTEDRKILEEIALITAQLTRDLKEKNVPLGQLEQINKRLETIKEKLYRLTSRYKTGEEGEKKTA